MDNRDRISYFENRLKRIGLDRHNLSARELQTLDNILRFSCIGTPINTALDLGCGDGYLENEFQRRGTSYTGLDIKDCNFDNQPLPYPDKSFDLVVCLAVIEHLLNPIRVLRECFRVLTPGGVLYVTTPNWKMDYKNFYNDYTHVSPFTPASLSSAFRDAGFSNIATYPGLRCKPDWYYKGRLRFLKAYYLLPFRGSNRYAPEWLKGHARSIICVGVKAHEDHASY